MGKFVDAVVRPFMKLAYLTAATTWYDLPRPTGSTGAHASGADPLRVLLIGCGPAVGFGVLTHDLALPGGIARQLSTETGRGVDVDLIVDIELTARGAYSRLDETMLSRYDAVIVMLGLFDALTLAPAAQWRIDMSALLTLLEFEGAPCLRTFVLSVPPMPEIRMLRLLPAWIANRHGRALNAELPLACEGHPRTSLLPFPPQPAEETSRFRGPKTYRAWARAIAVPIAAQLTRPDDAAPPVDWAEEEERIRALDRLEILDSAADSRFTRVTDLAQSMFGTAASAITFIDRDRQWFKARSGFELSEIPRDGGFCDYTIRADSAFVVTNAVLDGRFADNPFVTGYYHVRFYAGYPIVSPEGQRVGVFCIYDTRPREFSEEEAVMLRNLALLVQDELWADSQQAAVK
ncbi:hypothetical protein ABIB15_000646 [Marisediminicola sp. UYEF4]|uniref:GAF domain-containing protein n=1 Tax=Marisediminicola sp. UYEF4 TaxID=1756384 RepID=UPI003398205B